MIAEKSKNGITNGTSLMVTENSSSGSTTGNARSHHQEELRTEYLSKARVHFIEAVRLDRMGCHNLADAHLKVQKLYLQMARRCRRPEVLVSIDHDAGEINVNGYIFPVKTEHRKRWESFLRGETTCVMQTIPG